MNNVILNGAGSNSLNRGIKLQNGSIIIEYKKTSNNTSAEAIGVFYVTSFRDNKNRYPDCRTADYCAITNLDNGQIAFEERCSRKTTERRLLRHLNRIGYSYPYDPDSTEADSQLKGYFVKIYKVNSYKMNLDLPDEEIF